MKIYTKTGDKGQTGLVGGSRISKSSIRIEACGTIDELNAWMGLLGDYTINAPHVSVIREIQERLFTIGANIMTEPGKLISKVPLLLESDIDLLEKSIDKINEQLEPMRFFILPGGNKEVSFAHVARTVCRRAEREVVRLSEQEPVNDLIVIYLNRLSDYLFVLCRDMGRMMNVEEIPWRPRV
jgi:cob(I)alamin adenosyltransferase